MLCQFDNLGGVDIVTTNDQESPLVGDISLRPCLIRQSGELQCIASPPSISQKKKRKEKNAVALLVLASSLLLQKKREGHLFHRLILHHGMSTKLHLGE